MNGWNISFNNRNIKKATFTIKKKNIDGIDINKILASKKEQNGKYNSSKYFIAYNHNRPCY